MKRRKISLIIFFMLLVVLSYFMLTPAPPKFDVGFRFIDKIEHFAAFFVLAIFLSYGTKNQNSGKKRVFLFSGAVLAVYGVVMEIIQQYTGRTAEFLDLIADLAGIIAGCLVSLFFL